MIPLQPISACHELLAEVGAQPWRPGLWGKGSLYGTMPLLWKTSDPARGMTPLHEHITRGLFDDALGAQLEIVVLPTGRYAPNTAPFEWRDQGDPAAELTVWHELDSRLKLVSEVAWANRQARERGGHWPDELDRGYGEVSGPANCGTSREWLRSRAAGLRTAR
jgi:hypothetical protein